MYGWAVLYIRLSRAFLLALLADLVLVRVCRVLLLGQKNYDCIWLAKFPTLLRIDTGR